MPSTSFGLQIFKWESEIPPKKLQSMNLSVVRFFHAQYRKLLVWKIFVNVKGNSHKKGINFSMSCENLYPDNFSGELYYFVVEFGN